MFQKRDHPSYAYIKTYSYTHIKFMFNISPPAAWTYVTIEQKQNTGYALWCAWFVQTRITFTNFMKNKAERHYLLTCKSKNTVFWLHVTVTVSLPKRWPYMPSNRERTPQYPESGNRSLRKDEIQFQFGQNYNISKCVCRFVSININVHK